MSNTENNSLGCLIIVTILVIAFAPFRFSRIGQGTHTGYITAVDESGYIFRNYDVYFKTDSSSSQEDLYCVHRNDVKLVEELREYSKKGQKVTIEYKGVRDFGFGLCNQTQIKGVSHESN